MEEVKQIGYYQKVVGVEHHFDLNCAIEDPDQFQDFFITLREASPDDVVYIHLNTPGGCLYTTLQILTTIENCKAPVVALAEGCVESGGALIFFSADAFQIGENSRFLIHSASGGIGHGKVADHMTSIAFEVERIAEMYKRVFEPFLTEDELERVSRGEEFYLSPEQVSERIEAHIEKQEEEEDAGN